MRQNACRPPHVFFQNDLVPCAVRKFGRCGSHHSLLKPGDAVREPGVPTCDGNARSQMQHVLLRFISCCPWKRRLDLPSMPQHDAECISYKALMVVVVVVLVARTHSSLFVIIPLLNPVVKSPLSTLIAHHVAFHHYSQQHIYHDQKIPHHD